MFLPVFISISARAAAFSNSAAGTAGAAFLEIPQGAREEAMGGASAASVAGAEALFWNPAGLAALPADSRSEAAIGYNDWLQTTYAGTVALARRAGPGVLGAGLVYFSQAPQTAYDSLGNSVGTFTPYDMAFMLSYAVDWNGVRLGASAKVIHSQIADARNLLQEAFDLGVQDSSFTTLSDGALDIGASVANIGAPIKVGGVASSLPFEIKGGFLWHMYPYLNVAADAHLPLDGAAYASLGLEGILRQDGWTCFLRLGYDQGDSRNIQGANGITAGAGIDFDKFRIDYAWAPFGYLGTTNRVDLSRRF